MSTSYGYGVAGLLFQASRDGRDSSYLSNMAQVMFGFYLGIWRKEGSDNPTVWALDWVPGPGFPRQHRSWSSPGIHSPLGLILLCSFWKSVFCHLGGQMLHSCWWWHVSNKPSSRDQWSWGWEVCPDTSLCQGHLGVKGLFPPQSAFGEMGSQGTSSIRSDC